MERGGGLILVMGILGKFILEIILRFNFWDFLCRVYNWFLLLLLFLLLFRFDNFDIDIKIYFIIIFLISFVISASYLILFYRMMVKLDKDREKPLNLFLTIKNKVFEDLKNSSENFSNKLYIK